MIVIMMIVKVCLRSRFFACMVKSCGIIRASWGGFRSINLHCPMFETKLGISMGNKLSACFVAAADETSRLVVERIVITYLRVQAQGD